MELNRVGASGLEVSSLTLGTLEFGRRIEPATCQQLVDAFASGGGTLLELPSSGAQAAKTVGGLRVPDSVGIAARVGLVGTGASAHLNMGRATLLAQTEALIHTVGRDRIDLLILDGFDEQTPLEETAQAIAHLQARGLVVHVAAAYLEGWQLAVLRGADIDVVAAFNEHSLVAREAESDVLPAADYLGVGLIAGAGLGRGLLSGRYVGTVPADARTNSDLADYVAQLDSEYTRGVVNGVLKAASALGAAPVDIVTAWNSVQPQASTCVSPRTTGQLQQLMDSDLLLAPEIQDVLDQISAV